MKDRDLIWWIPGMIVFLGLLVSSVFLSVFVPATRIYTDSQALPLATGLTVMILGQVAGFSSIRPRNEALRRGDFSRDGAFSYSRHPLYVAAASMIFPAIGIALNNWVLTMALLVWGWLMFIPFMRREDIEMLQTHGQRYQQYASEVGWLFSFGKSRRHDCV